MNRNERWAILILLCLLLLGFLFWALRPAPKPAAPAAGTPSAATPAPRAAVATAPAPQAVSKAPQTKPKPAAPRRSEKSASAAGPASLPTPPKIELHQELIPKDIMIVRCYYGQEIVAPDTTFGFDINGSGFTPVS